MCQNLRGRQIGVAGGGGAGGIHRSLFQTNVLNNVEPSRPDDLSRAINRASAIAQGAAALHMLRGGGGRSNQQRGGRRPPPEDGEAPGVRVRQQEPPGEEMTPQPAGEDIPPPDTDAPGVRVRQQEPPGEEMTQIPAKDQFDGADEEAPPTPMFRGGRPTRPEISQPNMPEIERAMDEKADELRAIKMSGEQEGPGVPGAQRGTFAPQPSTPAVTRVGGGGETEPPGVEMSEVQTDFLGRPVRTDLARPPTGRVVYESRSAGRTARLNLESGRVESDVLSQSRAVGPGRFTRNGERRLAQRSINARVGGQQEARRAWNNRMAGRTPNPSTSTNQSIRPGSYEMDPVVQAEPVGEATSMAEAGLGGSLAPAGETADLAEAGLSGAGEAGEAGEALAGLGDVAEDLAFL